MAERTRIEQEQSAHLDQQHQLEEGTDVSADDIRYFEETFGLMSLDEILDRIALPPDDEMYIPRDQQLDDYLQEQVLQWMSQRGINPIAVKIGEMGQLEVEFSDLLPQVSLAFSEESIMELAALEGKIQTYIGATIQEFEQENIVDHGLMQVTSATLLDDGGVRINELSVPSALRVSRYVGDSRYPASGMSEVTFTLTESGFVENPQYVKKASHGDGQFAIPELTDGVHFDNWSTRVLEIASNVDTLISRRDKFMHTVGPTLYRDVPYVKDGLFENADYAISEAGNTMEMRGLIFPIAKSTEYRHDDMYQYSECTITLNLDGSIAAVTYDSMEVPDGYSPLPLIQVGTEVNQWKKGILEVAA